jgi:AcrR family transcriptional regulator
VLDAARDEFAEHGFHDATMDAIAARGGTTKPTVYAHFKSKEELHRATLEREVNLMAGRLFRAYESAVGLPLNEQLQIGMEAFFDFVHSNPQGFEMLFGSDSAPSPAARDWLFDAINRRVSDLVRSFAATQDLDVGVSADIIGAMLIGLGFYGAREALKIDGLDAAKASELATAFSDAALRNVDPETFGRIDAAAVPKKSS